MKDHPWEKDMIPSKYEGSILEDDIIEEPFTIEVKKDMKTLEEAVHQFKPMTIQEVQAIAAAVRKWMKEQNKVLRKAVHGVIANNWELHRIDINILTDAILSVIPPRGLIDPNTLQTEMEKWQASRIQELETTLSAVRGELDKLRPIRQAQKGRIQSAADALGNGNSEPSESDLRHAVFLLKEFLVEIQKAIVIHTEIDRIVESTQISQMEEQREGLEEPDDEFNSDTIKALKEFEKRSREDTIMIGGRPMSTKISTVEVEEMTALLGRKTDTRTLEQVIEEASRSVEATEARVFRDGVRNQYETIADAVREWLSQHNFAILQANRIKELEAEVERLLPKKLRDSDAFRGVADKAAKYDKLREKFPFLPGEEFFFLSNKGKIVKDTVESLYEDRVCGGGTGDIFFGNIYHTVEECRNAIEVEE